MIDFSFSLLSMISIDIPLQSVNISRSNNAYWSWWLDNNREQVILTI